MPKLTSNIKRDIIYFYNIQNKSLHDIAKIVGVCRPSVRKVLREAGVRNVCQKDIIHTDTLKEDFFDKIDTEEKAYFLGFMFADGNNYINKKRNTCQISLCLQERDKIIIENLRDTIAPDHNIYFVKKGEKHQNQYRILFNSKHMSNSLSKLGCVPAKALKIEFPNQNIFNNKNLIRHFVRGYFDGDGCIAYYRLKNGYKNFNILISSTIMFCKSLHNILKNKFDINATISTRKDNGISSDLRFGGNLQVYRFANWMYNEAKIYLPRKYNKFLELEEQNLRISKK